ncbi:hypothetical protein RIF29_05721 [Crotalaria pallida]|uniref:Uncharacterized protein n=1 Tax=Crotalaria pallida TaxID=3830 RepID=A0AAN9PB32_CROPI
MNRVWIAGTVAAAQVVGHTDTAGHKWKTALNSIRQNRYRLFSSGAFLDLRPLSGLMGSEFAGAVTTETNSSDDSLRKVMYLNCWGQG